MRRPNRTAVLFALAGLQPLLVAQESSIARSLQDEFSAVVRKTAPGIVAIRTFVRGGADSHAGTPAEAAARTAGWAIAEERAADYPGFRLHGTASGFFTGGAGDVLTTLLPLRVDGDRLVDLVEIETHDGHRLLADVLGIEPTLQIAALRPAVADSWVLPKTASLPFADSDALPLGSWLLAAGDPAGPERFLATGLLVAKPSRDCYQELMSATYMQATMTLHPGAFGGPLLDLDGRVVGILSPLPVAGLAAHPSTTWALPSKLVEVLHDAIRTAGTSRSPWLGIAVMSRAEIVATRGFQAFQELAKPPHGILLENVYAPSPAAAAGLQPGDFLTHFDGREIHAPVDFQRQLYLAGVGRTATLRIWRAGKASVHELVVEVRPPEAKPR
jgi:S1-C subfamily serine protease